MKILRKTLGYKFVLSPLKKSRNTRRERLVDIIRYANAHTPFYKGYFDYFLQSSAELPDNEFYYAYSHLPIVTKQDLRDQNDAFMSDHLLHKTDFMGSGTTPSAKDMIVEGLFKKSYYTSLSTGGSSGVPTYRWLDYDDANLFAQSFLHSFKRNGWNEGENFVVYYPLKSYFTSTYAQHRKTLGALFGFTMVPFENVTKESVEELLATLKKTRATLLVIFPCVLQRVAEIMHREGLSPFYDLPCINVSGEFFMDCSKDFIQSVFPDSDIQSTYGAVEFGEIAHQKGRSSFDYDVFDDYAFIEQGANNSILVTTYGQKAFPLIRYQIQDMGQVITNEDGSQSICNLEGKNEDYLVGADGYMYFASFFNAMVNDINQTLGASVIHFMVRHVHNEHESVMQANFVMRDDEKRNEVHNMAYNILSRTFANYGHIDVRFHNHFEHDYTRKFKIIGEGDGLAEVVGGYYQRKAS